MSHILITQQHYTVMQNFNSNFETLCSSTQMMSANLYEGRSKFSHIPKKNPVYFKIWVKNINFNANVHRAMKKLVEERTNRLNNRNYNTCAENITSIIFLACISQCPWSPGSSVGKALSFWSSSPYIVASVVCLTWKTLVGGIYEPLLTYSD